MPRIDIARNDHTLTEIAAAVMGQIREREKDEVHHGTGSTDEAGRPLHSA